MRFILEDHEYDTDPDSPDFIGEGELDDLVHEAASLVASSVNNGGAAEQAEFLISNGFAKPKVYIIRRIES